MNDLVQVHVEQGAAQVFLNRPSAYNAFDLETMSLFAEKVLTLAMDPSVKGLVISGRGKAFCAGGDLRWVISQEVPPNAAFHRLASAFHSAILEIRRMRKPVVAAINGIAAGGGFSLALACDFRIMERSAMLKQAYTSAGLCLDGGGTFMLPRLVGYARAIEIAALDEPVSSEQALTWGLVNRVVDDGKAVEEAMGLVRRLAQRSLNSFGWAKQLLNDSFETPFETVLEKERVALSTCAAHPDGQEGLSAFTQKRAPRFGVGSGT